MLFKSKRPGEVSTARYLPSCDQAACPASATLFFVSELSYSLRFWRRKALISHSLMVLSSEQVVVNILLPGFQSSASGGVRRSRRTRAGFSTPDDVFAVCCGAVMRLNAQPPPPSTT